MKYNLSEINNCIRNRRTIYPEWFSERKVHREMVEVLLENARWAPTHGMTQPWRFIVFEDDGIRSLANFQAELYRKSTPAEKYSEQKYEKYKTRPLSASYIIAVGMSRQKSGKIPEIEELASVACAVQNMLLTATAYGIGAFWSSGGPTYHDEMKRFLNLGEADRCMGFIYLGYPSVDWPKSQRKPMEYYTEWVGK